jgi:carotenoid cleavage dioxygenase-like enzyme
MQSLNETATGPSYLAGPYAPVREETEAVDLPVKGELPAELSGRYFRDGPNPVTGEDPGHWFVGSGMVHGVRISHGAARWYRNRWVRTSRLAGAPFFRADGTMDLSAVSANTNVIRHAGRMLALVENGLPYELGPDLDTIGAYDFAGRLTTAMTAHPKQDPVTGELHSFGYSAMPPYLTYHRVSADGELLDSQPVAVPGPTMMHDFAITERYVIWLDLPVTFDLELVGRSDLPYAWNDGYGARLGVMAKEGGPVRWFDIDDCYVFHVANAYEDKGGNIVLDGARYDRQAWLGVNAFITGSSARSTVTEFALLHRWTINLAAGTVTEQGIGDSGMEFPTHNDGRTGRAYQYVYSVSAPLDGTPSAIVKYDVRAGTVARHDLGTQRIPGEAVFVPAAGASREDDGWLIGIATHATRDTAELFVLDASDMAAPPVASVELPHRVPPGFHGSWFADEPGEVAN